ncbi:MAG: hypothetical protein WC884_03745 [Candidatus Paceibacterota bacterium]
MAQFWDVVYYLFAYKTGISFQIAERILFFLLLFVPQVLSFIGFKKIKALFDLKADSLAIFVITLWFCFNTYTLVLWHVGVYNLGAAITASLAPLIFYYFYTSVFTKSAINKKIICSTLLLIASFTFSLFAVLVFFLIIFSFLYILFNRKSFIPLVKNLGILLACYIPLVGIIIFTILHEYFGNAGDLNASFLPTYGNEQGGLWYQFLMLFSWAIYQVWTPRSIFSFNLYFFTRNYIFSTLLIYLVGLCGLGLHFFKYLKELVKKNNNKILERVKLQPKDKVLIILVLILGLGLFFAKADQRPLGEIFTFMYNKVPFFSVFRSADVRFGFLIVFMLSTILLFVSPKINKYVFFGLIFIVMLGQDILFFNGTAIYGQNKEGSFYDRIVYISKDYQEVIKTINLDNGSFGFVLPLPPVEFGDYEFDKEEHHIGQDMLPKLINKPFVYTSQSTGISGLTMSTLYKSLVKKDYKSLSTFPIKYIILRRDVTCVSCTNPSEIELQDNFNLVLKNNTFSVYKNEAYSPIIDSANSVFKVINPVKYRVKMTNVTNKIPLGLMLSFNKNWKVYVTSPSKDFCNNNNIVTFGSSTQCLSNMRYFEGEELYYNLATPSFDSSHFLVNGYANGWIIDPSYIKDVLGKNYYTKNPDGSINFDLIVFYKPQAGFYFFGIVSSLVFLSMGLYLFKVTMFLGKK